MERKFIQYQINETAINAWFGEGEKRGLLHEERILQGPLLMSKAISILSNNLEFQSAVTQQFFSNNPRNIPMKISGNKYCISYYQHDCQKTIVIEKAEETVSLDVYYDDDGKETNAFASYKHENELFTHVNTLFAFNKASLILSELEEILKNNLQR